jgi:hypothetical protein
MAEAKMRVWKILFALAALSNLTVGLGLLLSADRFAQDLGVSGPAAGYVVGFAGVVIAVFGVGYGLAALDPLANRPLVVIGALGKASAVALTSWHAAAGHIPNNIYLTMMGDLIWAIVFAVFLQQTRKVISARPPLTGSA